MREFTPADAIRLVGAESPFIVEAGCNDGEDTKRFLDAMRGGEIVCFDCEPRAIEKWKARIADPRAVLIERALADEAGWRTFHPSGGQPPGKQWEDYGSWDKSGSCLPPDQHKKFDPWLEFTKPYEVQAIRLDDCWVVTDATRVDFIWADLQGFEAVALRGAPKTLSKTRYVYVECHGRPYYKGQATMDDLKSVLAEFELVECCAADNYLFGRRTG